MSRVDDDDLLAEQRAYYRARAPEYDDWWQRRGRYDRGPALRAEWERQIAVVADAVAAFDARGHVLELAGGTGWWTERLARTADRITVVDSAPEALEISRSRLQGAEVEYVVADLFEWRPDRTYDAVCFSFWLSHVPRVRFAVFWDLVRSCLAPGGRAFLIDNREDPTPTSPAKDPYVLEYEPDLHRRTLNDGSEHRVVKVMYEPAELERLIEAEGWDTHIDATRWFIFGSASPR